MSASAAATFPEGKGRIRPVTSGPDVILVDRMGDCTQCAAMGYAPRGSSAVHVRGRRLEPTLKYGTRMGYVVLVALVAPVSHGCSGSAISHTCAHINTVEPLAGGVDRILVPRHCRGSLTAQMMRSGTVDAEL